MSVRFLHPYILGGSWDLVSMVISTLIGVISNSKYSYHNNTPIGY